MKFPKWAWYAVAILVLLALTSTMASGIADSACPGSQVYCPGVGCVSGPDKCVAGNKGGASAVFSKEGFEVMKPKAWNADWAKFTDPAFHFWPGSSKPSIPPEYGKENFVSKSCPGGYRSDGPCLMEFPDI
jgi:hypothetical protein